MQSLLRLSIPLLLLISGAVPSLAMIANKVKPTVEKCEWRKMRRHHPRRCVTESGMPCAPEKCAVPPKKR